MSDKIDELIKIANNKLCLAIKQNGIKVTYEQLPIEIKKNISLDAFRRSLNRLLLSTSSDNFNSSPKNNLQLKVTKNVFMLSSLLKILNIDLSTLFSTDTDITSYNEKDATLKILDSLSDKIDYLYAKQEEKVNTKYSQVSIEKLNTGIYQILFLVTEWNKYYNVDSKIYNFNLFPNIERLPLFSYEFREKLNAMSQNRFMPNISKTSFIFYYLYAYLQSLFPTNNKYTKLLDNNLNINDNNIFLFKIYIFYTVFIIFQKVFSYYMKDMLLLDTEKLQQYVKSNWTYSNNNTNRILYTIDKKNKKLILESLRKTLKNINTKLNQLLNITYNLYYENKLDIIINSNIDCIFYTEFNYIFNSFYNYPLIPIDGYYFSDKKINTSTHKLVYSKNWINHFKDLLYQIDDITNYVTVLGY